jgi:hypothetical protein
MMQFSNIPGQVGPGLNPAADATAQEIGKALFLAGKIKCDCEVCKLLISAGTKVIKQLADTTVASPAAGEVPPGQPAADQSPGG